jgi:hypothetical protein
VVRASLVAILPIFRDIFGNISSALKFAFRVESLELWAHYPTSKIRNIRLGKFGTAGDNLSDNFPPCSYVKFSILSRFSNPKGGSRVELSEAD